MSIIIACGAFKHSLDAITVTEAVARGLRLSGLTTRLERIPTADGGNGTLAAFLGEACQRLTRTVRDPLGRQIEAAWGKLEDGETAVIEMALASGLELVSDDERSALHASTYGTGQLMQAALDAGIRRLIIGMGGSATTDGGAGCMQALGIRLLDAQGADLPPGGGSLHQLHTIDTSRLDPRWQAVEIIIASDVENPALGAQGAAAVFAPQKGASPAEVALLEANLRHYFDQIEAQIGSAVHSTPGGGAAGAFGAGVMAFLNGRIESGIDLILDHAGFDALLADASLVITGEGKIDNQTIFGKGPFGVARRAGKRGVKTIALCGSLDADEQMLHEAGLWAVLPIVDAPMTLESALQRAEALVERAALRLGYLLQVTP
jgi:glycerate kinase